MAKESEKDRIRSMIDAVTQAAGGDYSICVPPSGGNDDLDLLAEAINLLLEEVHQREIERQGAEEALRESEELYRRLVAKVPDIVVRTSIDGIITFINEVGVELSGFSNRDEIVGKSMLSFIAPEDHPEVIKNTGLMFERPLGPKEYTFLKKDGGRIPLEVNGDVLRGLDGVPYAMAFIGRDITERRRTEEALRASEDKFSKTFYTSPDSVNVNRLSDGLFVEINQGFTALTGYTPEEVMGKTSTELVIWADPQDRARLLQGLQERGEVRNLEACFRLKDGRVKTGLMSARILQINGEPCILSITRDITERKSAEEQRANLEAQLFQAQKMESIGRLAGGVAHDFNNMLSVILGYAELMKSRLSADASLLMDLLEIEKAAGRARDITRQLLAFSRKQIIAPKPIQLNELISNTQKTLSRLIGEDIDLCFSPGKDLWRIRCDSSQVDQVLVNLVVNARDAMPDGGKLEIETQNIFLDKGYCRDHPEFTPGQYVLLRVSDTGIGMDKEVLSHAFEPFFTTKEVGKGTGLGLATVYGMVTQNGGVITVESEPGQGTTFSIYLPIMTEEEEEEEKGKEAPVTPGAGTVLLVEDDEMVRGITMKMLERLGYSVLAPETPGKALSLCERGARSIDLLVTDVVMPEMNGTELRERISAIRPGMKVLFMSGYTSDAIVHRGVLDEGVHFILKPFTINDLARKVREALGDE